MTSLTLDRIPAGGTMTEDHADLVEEKAARGKYPRAMKRVGKSPPEYAGLDEDDE